MNTIILASLTVALCQPAAFGHGRFDSAALQNGLDVRTADDSGERAKDGSAIAVPIFSEQWCHITRPRDLQLGHMTAVDTHSAVVRFGAAFAYRTGGRVLLVTAAHVVPPAGSVSEIAAADGTVYSVKDGYGLELGPCKVRVGGLALQPKRWVVDPDLDVALLELDASALASMNVEVLTVGSVKRNEEIRLWGYPALPQNSRDGVSLPPVPSASQTSQRSDVTDVRTGEVVCAPLNGIETRGGFSGGPVLNGKDQVVGMVMRSTAETTRCRAMPAIDKLAEAFAVADAGRKQSTSAPKVMPYADPPSPGK